MKRYIYLIAAVAMLFVGCAKGDIDSASSGNGLDIPGDGKVTLALNLKLKGADIQSVATRATTGTNWAEKENVTKITGYAFVFGNDPDEEDTYGDGSPLLQKVAFKSVVQNDGEPTIYVTFDEQNEPCFIRLMTSMTQPVRDQIEGFVSQKQIDAGEADKADLTTFEDYKHISVTLLGYYQDAENPDPNNLTSNQAFPLASPGISLDKLDATGIGNVNKVIYMIPAASKVDVSVGTGCDFTLDEVTLINGAKKARMRSTVLEDDGITHIYELPLPINLGGITQFVPVSAIGNTTASTPIYFFPNEGDGPFDAPADPENEYPANSTELSDVVKGENPTYLIVKGRATGYSVDGYYKIAIVYKPVILGADGEPTGETEQNFTYDIIRNNHYKVSLNKVDNPGYASFAEALAGPANNIAYDIEIDGGNSSNDDTFTDSRAETIVSHNGFFYVELVGSEVYAQGYGSDGVTGNFGLSLTRNSSSEFPDGYDIPTLYITATDGITITNNATISDDNFAGTIGFTATQSGTISLRCGDMLKEIPVYYTETPHIYGSGATIGGAALSAVSSFAADSDADANDVAMIDSDGSIAENTSYQNREFRGKAYPTDMSQGIRKVYVKQASNFDLNTYYDNTAAGNGGNTGSNNIFSPESTSTMSSEYNARINYQSTGKVYQINSVNQGTLDESLIMTNWWIGDANIAFTANGEFTSLFTGSISSTFTSDTWSNITNGSVVNLNANDIGNNQIGSTYDASRSQISNSAVLTLTNIAGQTKTYNFNLDQYAAPFIEGLTLVNGIYQYNCHTVADCYGISNNRDKAIGTTPKVYNAHYQGGNDPWPDSDWSWAEAPDEDGYTGGSSGLSAVSAGVRVEANPSNNPNATEYYFEAIVNGLSLLNSNNNKRQAYFDLRLTNDANELIYLRLRIRREDDSQ